jgi:DnaJ-class molecular chaperone
MDDQDGDADADYSDRFHSTRKSGAPFSASSYRCHYSILGLPRFADLHAIRQQYRKLTLRYHPDKCVNESAAERKKSEMRFKEISTSYHALADAAAKEQYDLGLRANGYHY